MIAPKNARRKERERTKHRTEHRHCEDRLILTYASQVIAILIKSG